MAESVARQCLTEGETHVSVHRTQDGIVCCVWWKLRNFFSLDTENVHCCPLEPTRSLCTRDWSLAFKVYEKSVYVSIIVQISRVEVSFSVLTNDRQSPFAIMGGLEEFPGIYACLFPRAALEDHFRKVEGTNFIVMCRVVLTDEDAAKLDTSASRIISSSERLFRDLDVLFLSQRFADLRLVKGLTEFPVHRCFLSARSSKLCEALSNQGPSQDRFLLQYDASINNRAIVEALRFIYTGRTAELNPDLAVPLFHVAEELELEELKESCLTFLQHNITVPSFLRVLNLALVTNCKPLKEKAELFFIQHKKGILKKCFPRNIRGMIRPNWMKPQEHLILQLELERLARINMTSLFFESD